MLESNLAGKQPHRNRGMRPSSQHRHSFESSIWRALRHDGDDQLIIEFPGKGRLRARKVVKRSNARSTGKYPSIKAMRMLQFESKHEMHAMQLLDAYPDVSSFTEQPCVIHYGQGGKLRRHYPDFLVETISHGKEFWEVKPRREAQSPEVIGRTEQLTRLLAPRGYGYRLVCAEDIVKEPRFSNVKMIIGLGRAVVVSDQLRELLRRVFRDCGVVTWGVFDRSIRGVDYRPYVCRLILDGVLAFDMHQALTGDTRIYWVRQGGWKEVL